MAKKKKKAKNAPLHVTIQVELPEDDNQPSAIDVFAYKFLETLSYWIFGGIRQLPALRKGRISHTITARRPINTSFIKANRRRRNGKPQIRNDLGKSWQIKKTR